MKVLFHANTLNYRGTTVAVADYAKYNQEVLGNESIIAYCKTYGQERDMGNEPFVIEALEKKFKVVGYREGSLEKKIDELNIDLTYMIDSGQKKAIPTNSKTAVHAVFQFNEPYGDRYAYISKWLSDEMSQGQIPYVPHIVNLPPPTQSYRTALGLEGKIVIGRLGGYYTFDIQGIKEYIKKLVTNNDKFVFLFAGTEPFIDHPNVEAKDEAFKFIVEDYTGDGGWWNMFANLVSKYGLVPISAMKETFQSDDSEDMNQILNTCLQSVQKQNG